MNCHNGGLHESETFLWHTASLIYAYYITHIIDSYCISHYNSDEHKYFNYITEAVQYKMTMLNTNITGLGI